MVCYVGSIACGIDLVLLLYGSNELDCEVDVPWVCFSIWAAEELKWDIGYEVVMGLVRIKIYT